jgi:methylenetetrahydrofolate reductase (NADPH)
MELGPRALDVYRYEILPFGSAQRQAVLLERPLTLTVTCSPKQGIDQTVEYASGLRALGHTVIVHLAARMVRDRGHLDTLLGRMADDGVRDVFLVGGDAPQPHGEFGSALDLLPVLRAHPDAPRTIGVAAYPEGHPLIDDRTLLAALRAKAGLADYMTTQLCFDSDALLRWLERMRHEGLDLPLCVGLPGCVDRRSLLEVSVRVGVGASVSFMRKQQGLRRLLGRRRDATEELFTTFAPLVGGDLGVAGLHFFTFNRLVETAAFAEHPLPVPAIQEHLTA